MRSQQRPNSQLARHPPPLTEGDPPAIIGEIYKAIPAKQDVELGLLTLRSAEWCSVLCPRTKDTCPRTEDKVNIR